MTTQRLTDVARIFPGLLSRGRVEDRPDGTHHLLQIRDFNSSKTRINMENVIRIIPARAPGERCLLNGDVVYLSRGVKTFAHAVRDFPQPAMVAGYFFILRPCPELLPEYLAWHLNQEGTRMVIDRQVAMGAAMPVVRKSVLAELDIPLPPMEAQRKIADLSELALRECEIMKALANEKDQLWQAVCRQMVTKQLLTGEQP